MLGAAVECAINQPQISMDPITQSATQRSAEAFEFGEWLEEAAESSGLSEEALLEDLIDSYETLNEVGKILHQGRGAATKEVPAQAARAPEARQEEPQGVGLSAAVEERLDAIEERLTALESRGDPAAIEGRMDTEFESLRRILEQHIAMTKANEAAIADLQRRLDE